MASQNRTHASDRGKVIPDIPGTLTIGTATVSGTQATVAFTANVLGGLPTSYTALSSPGSITQTGSSSPITVTGLTGGTSYTFTVRANNATGSSDYSSASNSVTATAPASGMYLWYDASDAATITSSGGDVSAWADKSGNGFTMTPATSLKPKTGVNTRNSKNVMTFTQVSSGGYGGFKNSSTYWGSDPNLDVWIVKKHITDTIGINGSAFGIGNDSGSNRVHYSFLDRTNNKLLSGSSGGQIYSTATQLNNWVLTRFTKTGAAAEFFLNGTSQGTASVNYNLTQDVTTIGAIPQSSGAVYVMEGDIAEVIVYKTAITGTDYTNTYNYLKDKWGF